LLSRIISRIDSLKLPDDPKTTVNVGAIEGGTTINTIAAQSSCLVDMRSVEPATLQRLVESVEQIAKDCTKLADVSMTMTQIGNRPAGVLPRNTPVVTWAVDALRYVDCQDINLMAGSTDANIPISLGVPSVCVGLAKSGNAHRLDEFLDPANLPKGLAQLLLLTLAASGLESELDNEKE
jgi:acetylornithine deacetylase/succinyl-diaminopimelate desuccinylase-like protein